MSCFIVYLIILLVGEEEITLISLAWILKWKEETFHAIRLTSKKHDRDNVVIKINLCTQTFSYAE